MFINKNIKYRDILVLAIIGIIGYKLIDSYQSILDFFGNIFSIVIAFIYAAIFAYVLNPVVKMLEKRCKMSRGVAILTTYILVTGILIVIGIYIIPPIIDSIVDISNNIPSYVEKAQSWVNSILSNKGINSFIKQIGLFDTISKLSSDIGAFALNLLQCSISSIVSFTTNVLMIIVGYLIAVYMLLDKENLLNECRAGIIVVFKEKYGRRILEVLAVYNKMIGVYLGTKALDSFIIGIMAFVGLLILDVPYALLIAFIVMVTNMIPYIGPFIGEAVGVFISIFVSFDLAIKTFILLFIIQQFDAWFLDPKLIGNKVGVKPLILIFAVVLGGGLFGISGMLLASPTAATIKYVYDKAMIKFKNKHKKIIEEIEIKVPQKTVEVKNKKEDSK